MATEFPEYMEGTLEELQIDELERKVATIFLIDMHAPMLKANLHNGEEFTSNATKVLRQAKNYVKQKLLSGNNDKVSFVLHGRNKTEVLYPMDIPDASLMK